jgi:hypothetical protein
MAKTPEPGQAAPGFTLEGFAGVGATVWGIRPQDVVGHERLSASWPAPAERGSPCAS